MFPLFPLLLLLLFPHAAILPTGPEVRGQEFRSELRLLVRLAQSQAQDAPKATPRQATRPARGNDIAPVANTIPRPVRRTVRDRDGPISA